jgi:hypothetical protein
MIRVKFKVPKDEAWLDWVKRGREARRELVEAGVDKPAELINDKLYKEQRLRFLEAFHYKCAYCELKIVAGQRAGDVEHFRPKGRVMDANGKPVFSKEEVHPGYYWLAYRWHNLLPSCLACNRPGTDPRGYASGKWDKFPVEARQWARAARDVAREKPLLLNPWKDDPDEHLVFDDDTGVLGFKTLRGKTTIEILGLNRDGLPEARRKAYRNAQLAFRRFHESLVQHSDEEVEQAAEDLRQYLDGRAEFSAVGRAAAAKARRRYEERKRAFDIFGEG